MDFEHLTKVCEVCDERYWDVCLNNEQLKCVKCSSHDWFDNYKLCLSCGSYVIDYDDNFCNNCDYLLRRGKCVKAVKSVWSRGFPEGNVDSTCIFCGNFIWNTIEGGACAGCDIEPLTVNIKPAVQ